jgi:exopolysaccharide biosynthesis polyprenyl glycosylphosphotransferase
VHKLVLFVDALLVVASMLLAYGLHQALRPLIPLLKQPLELRSYAMLAFVAVPLWLVLVGFFGLHRVGERGLTRARLVIDLIKVHFLGFFGLSVFLYVGNIFLNRSILVLFTGCVFLLLYLERGLVQLWLRYQHRSGLGRERMLLVGEPSREMSRFVESTMLDFRPPLLVGYLALKDHQVREDETQPEQRHRPITGQYPCRLGTVEHLEEVLHREAVDWVLFFPPLSDPEQAGSLLEICETVGVPAGFAVRLVERDRVTSRVVALCEQPFISFERTAKAPESLAIKHLIDFVVAGFGLLVTAPLLLLVSAAILLTMGRPVFFGQRRKGLYGREFTMLKFRTMVRDAEERKPELRSALNEMDGPLFKSSVDPRVTPLGRWLRRFSFDELPQLFNVLTGSMSLVGPRPLPVDEQDEIYGIQRRRLTMKPGITGIPQVSGRNQLSFKEWMELDLRYIDQWSLTLDFWILLKAVRAVLSGRGAL